MVLSRYGVTIPDRGVNPHLARDPAGAPFEIEAARFAVARGFSADCHAYNLVITDPAQDALLPQSVLLATLRRRRPAIADPWHDEVRDATIRALHAGVGYRIAPPSLAVLRSCLHRGIPPILSVNPAALYRRMGDPRPGHAVVLTGLDAAAARILDPADGREHVLPARDVAFGVVARKIAVLSGYLIAIERRATATPSAAR